MTKDEILKLAERSCEGCVFLTTFKPRPDEQEQFGFGEVGHGCKMPGWEGYVVNLKPTCGRGPILRAASLRSIAARGDGE